MHRPESEGDSQQAEEELQQQKKASGGSGAGGAEAFTGIYLAALRLL